MSKKRGLGALSVILIIAISFAGGMLLQKFRYTGIILNKNALSPQQIRVLSRAMAIVQNYAIDEQDPDHTIDYALKGMAASLDDRYAYYYTAEEIKQYEESSNGIISGGIGVTIYSEGADCYVSAVYAGLGADKAGIKPGDKIIKVDQTSINEDNIANIAELVKGETGTNVLITVERDSKELAFNVLRSDGQRQMTEYRMLENGILYVVIHSFHGNAVEYFKQAIEYGEKNNYTSLLIDLRDNLGGSLDIFEEIADIILPQGETFYAMMRDGTKVSVCKSDAKSIDKPLCVLINANSASASEALAGALKCMGDASLVGTQSFGKGIMQTSYKLQNGGVFKLTVAKYYLPNGECIHEKGLTPDYTVELSDELNKKTWLRNDENDLQLKKAIEVLEQK